jgi:hypothetical protein
MDSAQENRTDAALAKVLRAAGVLPGNIQMLEDTEATLASMRAAYAVLHARSLFIFTEKCRYLLQIF